MSNHVLGAYWAPGHQRPTDIEYMRQLQPPAIRVLDPDPNQLVIAHHAAPNALILPRDWALSEQHDDVRRDPVGTGIRHAQDWRAKLDRWNLPIPANQIVVVGINEPRVWDMLPQVVDYTVAMLDECTRLQLRACALNLSVGWPANTGPATPPDWSPYAPIESAIQRGNHYLVVHEYWYRTGPRDGWGWFAGRIAHCPWDVPVIIGECGIDMYVDMERWRNDGQPNRGWRGNVEAKSYAYQIEQYTRGLDKRIVAILPFLTDYRSNNWESFDTAAAHADLLALAPNMIPQGDMPIDTHLPIINNGAPQPVPTPSDNWQRSRAFIQKWEGGWADHPADPGGATNKGITIGTFIRWRTERGLPVPTKEDLRAITDAEADQIYHEWYWLPSGADKLPWPMCLAVFDLAVNGGTGRSAQALTEAGNDFVQYMAWRIDWYTKISNFEYFGKAWMRRCAELMRVAGE